MKKEQIVTFHLIRTHSKTPDILTYIFLRPDVPNAV